MLHFRFLEPQVQAASNTVAPAAFDHEIIPVGDFNLGPLEAGFKAPLEQVIVRNPGESLLFELVVFDSKEVAATAIKARAEIFNIVLAERASRLEANFIHHAREVNDAAGLVIDAAGETGIHKMQGLPYHIPC